MARAKLQGPGTYPRTRILKKTSRWTERIAGNLKRLNGVVYTPEKLTEYISHKLVHYVKEDLSFDINGSISLVDPACGIGMLLEGVIKALRLYSQAKITTVGVDIDQDAILACRRLFTGERDPLLDPIFVKSNSLCPFEGKSAIDGWADILKMANLKESFDVLIANPPWGADVSNYRSCINPREFVTMKGQFDTFELFVELATMIVRKGGYFAFILPDSLLYLGKTNIREVLLNRTQIKFIARLGEKIFPGISRGCSLIICKNSRPIAGNLVNCFRLSSKQRELILSGLSTFDDAESRLAHNVSQSRFLNNPSKQFDIDLRESEFRVLEKMRSSNDRLSKYLWSSRGIELGLSGKVVECPTCETCSPMSEKSTITCKNCKKTFSVIDGKKYSIIFDRKIDGTVPLVTGRKMRRYHAKPSKWLLLGKKGILYKDKDIYASPKILVRKTGVGITASLDYTDSFTNQVVYILKGKRSETPSLEFFIGLINSRAYFFYLTKQYGEVEWRSHPYLTQSQILSLPVPRLSSRKQKSIVEHVEALIKSAYGTGGMTKAIDTEIETSVGSLFGFCNNDYRIIMDSLENAEQLVPVLALRDVTIDDLLGKVG